VQATANGEVFARLGIVVGKRVARRAVDRGYLKRLVRDYSRGMRQRMRLAATAIEHVGRQLPEQPMFSVPDSILEPLEQ
jgi:ribonuclease P protein component